MDYTGTPWAIVILNWNNGPDTIATVQTIQTWQSLTPIVWVVDNGSQDDSVERIRRECPAVRLLLSDHNLGFAAGNNLAIRQALAEGRASCFLLLNNDAVIEEEGARRLLDTLGRTRAGIVGPILRDPPPDIGLQAAGGLNPLWRVDTHMRHIPDTAKPYPVDYVPGTAILIAAEVFERVGLLDEDYFISGEIADFCLRARRYGYQPLVDPTVTVYHDTSRSSELRVAFYTYYFMRNRFLFVRKLYPRLRLPLTLYWGLFALVSIAGSLFQGQRRRVSALTLALRHGLTSQFGDRSQEIFARDRQNAQEPD
ncbi:MAG: glycosyltransferase family 2 protein [Chloroflexota bacterium]|nr:glycosyltransferase family 2 protein [Chloroflexota bacterium]